jgi:hypothetical protein
VRRGGATAPHSNNLIPAYLCTVSSLILFSLSGPQKASKALPKVVYSLTLGARTQKQKLTLSGDLILFASMWWLCLGSFLSFLGLSMGKLTSGLQYFSLTEEISQAIVETLQTLSVTPSMTLHMLQY